MKLSILEEKVSKAIDDIAKVKEQKRKEDEKRAKKEEQRVQKLREKEEEAARKEEKKRELASALKKKPEAAKDDAAVIKSRNIMQSFLRRKTETPPMPEPPPTEIPSQNVVPILLNGFDTLRFDDAIKLPQGKGSGTQKLMGRLPVRCPQRKPKKLVVSTESKGLNRDSGAAEVSVDSRMRMLSFAENVRPPYFGTFSKKSSVICGRRPLAKDHRLFDYEYDSECDWEEESEGEDIAESINEEDEGGNELEFDEFCLRDNDFGSDIGSDDEGLVMQTNRSLSTVAETLGPRFFVSRDIAFNLQGEHLSRCPGTEKDFIRLQTYFPILHKSLPALGRAEGKPETESAVAPEKDAREFSSDVILALAHAVHGKKDSVEKIVQGFLASYPDFSKVSIVKFDI